MWRDTRKRKNPLKSEPSKTKLNSKEFRKKTHVSKVDLVPVEAQI